MLNIREAIPADIPQILAFIRALATYEREPDAVHATESDLLRDGFGETPRFYCLIADWAEPSTPSQKPPTNNQQPEANSQPSGFALYFHNYSTWRGHHGIHIEDLFVQPEHRGKGIGKALLTRVAAIAAEEGCTRLQWDVLEWNKPAIDFYEKMGAVMLSDWRIMRVTNQAIPALASQSR
jgi:ribosomal protein S18 acetylase RimI-like enzyme